MASFVFQDGVLTRGEGRSLTLYGAWLKRFGCWYTETGEPPYLLRVPTISFLDADGYYVPREFTGEGMDGDEVPASWIALEQYVDSIPPKIARLAGKFERHQWLALEAMRYVPGFTRFVRQELETADLGFIVACWELAETQNRPSHDRLQLARDIVTWKRAELLTRLTDLPFTRTIARLLQRSPDWSVTRGYVLDLYRAVQAEGLAQVLGQLAYMDSQRLEIARALPDWLRLPWLVEMICADGIEAASLGNVFTPEVFNAAPGHRLGIVQALRAVEADDLDCIYSLRDRWLLQFHGDQLFPVPPIPGDHRLRPIRDPHALIREGRDMAHCVGQYWQDVGEGTCFFYQWLGDERATVKLDRDSDAGRWTVVEYLGFGNEPLSTATIMAIRGVADGQLNAIQSAFTIRIVGAQYLFSGKQKPDLDPGDQVRLIREPGNAFSPSAISVVHRGQRLGYLDWRLAPDLAALIDAGGKTSATIASPTPRDLHTIYIDVEVWQTVLDDVERELRVCVAGTQFYRADTAWQHLTAGMLVTLRRELTNPHDPNAIEVYFESVKLGYVPRAKNSALAKAMDGGLPVVAYVDQGGLENPYDIPIRIEVGAARAQRAA